MVCADFDASLNTITPPLAVAVSGGADSLALLLLAHKWAQERGARIIALTVDHGLRPESGTEAHQVQTWVSQRGIDHVILRWEGEKPSSVSQEKARTARYQLLLSWCKAHSISTLLLGNHQEDQEETFWLRLASGSGLDGLSGMRKRWVREGITLLRPLLTLKKEQLKEILKAEDQPWIEDPSNENPRFFRGRFRTFLKEEGLSPSRLTKTMEKLQEDADFIWASLLKAVETTLESHEEGYITLHTQVFEDLPHALSKRLIALCMRWFSGSSHPPRSHHIQGIIDKLKTGSPFTVGGIYWFHQKGKIYLSRELSAIQGPVSLCHPDLGSGSRDNELSGHGIPKQSSIGIEDMVRNDTILWDNRFFMDAEIKKYLPAQASLTSLTSGLRQGLTLTTEIPRRLLPTLPAIVVQEKVVAIPHLCYNALSFEKDLKKFIIAKPLFHSLLRFTI